MSRDCRGARRRRHNHDIGGDAGRPESAPSSAHGSGHGSLSAVLGMEERQLDQRAGSTLRFALCTGVARLGGAARM